MEFDDPDQYIDRSRGQTDPGWIHFQSEKVRPNAIDRLRSKKSVKSVDERESK